MRTPLLLAAALALVPAAPRAAVPPAELGARLGLAAAFGSAAKDVPVRDLGVGAQVPLQLELSVRPRPSLAAGLYASYGLGRVDDAALAGACGIPGVSCTGRVVRAGVQARRSFEPTGPFTPWTGAALGWEWVAIEGRDVAGTSRATVNGWEATLEAGGEARVARRLAVGPYVTLGAGRYLGRAQTLRGTAATSGTVGSAAFHGWFGLGVAGRFELQAPGAP